MKLLLLLTVPFVFASCSTYDVPANAPSVAMERDEVRLYDAPRAASDDPSSPLSDMMLQRGRVGINAARF
jgi:hypothetical protein